MQMSSLPSFAVRLRDALGFVHGVCARTTACQAEAGPCLFCCNFEERDSCREKGSKMRVHLRHFETRNLRTQYSIVINIWLNFRSLNLAKFRTPDFELADNN
jgi:hypothetical protein